MAESVEDEAGLGGPRFNPPLYRQRYAAVAKLARERQARRVIDMGCAECKMLQVLKAEECIEELVGVDISLQLSVYFYRLRPLTSDYLHPLSRPLSIKLMQGSIADPDVRLLNFDLLSCIEVIEHLDPPILERVPHCIFGVLKPQTVVMTTPNAEFNVLFPGFSGFRHHDHRFEWTRSEFESWCRGVTSLHPYTVELSGVGDPPAGMEHVGPCSQMAVFSRLLREGSEDANIVDVGEPYQILHECCYPYRKPPTIEEKLCREAEYYLHLLNRKKENEENSGTESESGDKAVLCLEHQEAKKEQCLTYYDEQGTDSSDSSVTVAAYLETESATCSEVGSKTADSSTETDDVARIALSDLLYFPNISRLCTSVDEIRSALKLSEIVHLDPSEMYAVFPSEDLPSHSDLEESDLCASIESDVEQGALHLESGSQSEENQKVPPEMWD